MERRGERQRETTVEREREKETRKNQGREQERGEGQEGRERGQEVKRALRQEAPGCVLVKLVWAQLELAAARGEE